MGSARRQPGDALAESFPISVVIPCHNAAPYLSRTLPAVLANRLEMVEVIVVDDGSTDAGAQLLGQYEEDGSIRVLRSSAPEGPSAARNRGVEEAVHPWLLFIDADVVVPPETIEWVRDSLDLYSHRPEVVGVLGCYTDRIPSSNFVSDFKNLSTVFLYRATPTISPYLHTSIFAVRRDVLENSGGFNESLRRAEDFDLGVRLGSQGFRFVIDWRIRGIHLKPATLRGLLAEDWGRIQAMARIRISGDNAGFSMRAHRWHRLFALVLPGVSLLAALASGLGLVHWLWPFLPVALFALLNASFLRFLWKKRGLGFALRSLFLLFIEMLWAEPAAAWSLISRCGEGHDGGSSGIDAKNRTQGT